MRETSMVGTVWLLLSQEQKRTSYILIKGHIILLKGYIHAGGSRFHAQYYKYQVYNFYLLNKYTTE